MKSRIRESALFLLLLLTGTNLFSQSKDEQILKGIDYIYKLKLDSANTAFQLLVNQNPKDPTGYFFMAMTEWWKINLNRDDKSNDDNYLAKVDKCIKVCDERIDENENDDWATFLKGGVIGYRGFLNALRDIWLKAVDDGREGLSLIQRSYELNPNNKDAVFGIGLYNYAADYVTEKYPFLKALLFFLPKGNKELGLKQLRDCAENAKFSKTEASFVLCFIHLTYEKNYAEAEKYAARLNNLYPENPIFEKYLGRCYVGLNKLLESVNVWKSILSKIDSNKVGYNNKHLKRESTYYLALSYMNLNQHDDAIKYYQESLNLSKELDKALESPYQVFSALGLGIIHFNIGKRSDAMKYFDIVLQMKDIEKSHEVAKKYKDSYK